MQVNNTTYSPASLQQDQVRTIQSLRRFQVSQTQSAIAFKKAVLKLAGYGNHVDGYY